ncbi:MAG TPA: hypothetical protein VJI12_00240 [archaeon]|nr:hypothetical protein [archaeon]
MSQAATIDKPEIIMPYAAAPSEMKRKWVQTADGIYVSPLLATNKNGRRIVRVDWYSALDAARRASERGGQTFHVASYGEEIDAIRANKQAADEARNFAAWTRNRYETIKEGGKTFTRIYSYGPNTFADLTDVLKNGRIAGLTLGAPISVSDNPNPDFLDANLYYGDNPVVRGWGGRFDAAAYYRASNAYDNVGFRLVWYDRKEAEKILREQNKAPRRTVSDLSKKISAAKKV